jgi:hypothetical protein
LTGRTGMMRTARCATWRRRYSFTSSVSDLLKT